MKKEIFKLIIALAIIAGAIFVPDYRGFLNPLVGAVVGYYFATRAQLSVTAKGILGIKSE